MINKKIDAFRYLQNKDERYIPIYKLETGGLYWILARKAHIGIWFGQTKGFVIPRIKFDRKFLFVEYHWV